MVKPTPDFAVDKLVGWGWIDDDGKMHVYFYVDSRGRRDGGYLSIPPETAPVTSIMGRGDGDQRIEYALTNDERREYEAAIRGDLRAWQEYLIKWDHWDTEKEAYPEWHNSPNT